MQEKNLVPHPLAPETIQELIEALAIEGDLQATLKALFNCLQTRWSVSALSLKRETEHPALQYTFGETCFLCAEIAPDESPTHSFVLLTLNPAQLPIHTLHLAYPLDSPLFHNQKTQILGLIAPILNRRLEQEAYRKRGERAEDRARKRISEVAAIYEIGQALDQIEYSRLFELITTRAARIMDSQTCSLMVVNPETQKLKVVASYGLPEDAQLQEQMIGTGIAGIVAKTEQPLLITANRDNPLLNGISLRSDIRSSMLVPMKNPESAVLGVLSIRRNKPAPDFTEADLKVFSVFATQAALALTNKTLYDGLRKRAGELQKLTNLSRALISTINLDELVNRVADDICQIVGFDRCCLFLREGTQTLFIPKTWRGYSEKALRNPVHEGDGAVGISARSKEVLAFSTRDAVPIEEDLRRNYRVCLGFARSLGVVSFVAAPILNSQNLCIGVVVADNRGSREPISNDQISLLSAFVSQAGIAAENATLYATTQENLKNINRLNNETDNVLQSIGACILSADAQGVVFRWNRATEETLRLPPSAFRGSQLRDIIRRIELPEAEQKLFLEMVSRVMSSGAPVSRYKWTLHPANLPHMTVDLRMSRLADHNMEQAGIVLTFEDLTKEVRLEEEIVRMRRLADIGQLAARMAHEVRNALSPIRGAAQMMRVEGEGTEGIGEWAGIIVSEVDGLARLTSEMLDFARPTTLDIRTINIEEFLQNALQSSSSILIENNALLDIEIEPGLPLISADPHLLRQVVRNMIANAVQSMREGGSLRIEVASQPADQAVIFRFKDNGIGIPKGDIEKIFLPFFTTRVKGTGLGLPIVQKIVVQHGGKVQVESEVGKGTCVSIFLPIQPPAEIYDQFPEEPPVVGRDPGSFPDPYS